MITRAIASSSAKMPPRKARRDNSIGGKIAPRAARRLSTGARPFVEQPRERKGDGRDGAWEGRGEQLSDDPVVLLAGRVLEVVRRDEARLKAHAALATGEHP